MKSSGDAQGAHHLASIARPVLQCLFSKIYERAHRVAATAVLVNIYVFELCVGALVCTHDHRIIRRFLPQIHVVGPFYEAREKSEPLLRDAIKVSTLVAPRDVSPLAGWR